MEEVYEAISKIRKATSHKNIPYHSEGYIEKQLDIIEKAFKERTKINCNILMNNKETLYTDS